MLNCDAFMVPLFWMFSSAETIHRVIRLKSCDEAICVEVWFRRRGRRPSFLLLTRRRRRIADNVALKRERNVVSLA